MTDPNFESATAQKKICEYKICYYSIAAIAYAAGIYNIIRH